MIDNEKRIISGDVLTGRGTSHEDFLSFYDYSISVISDEVKREFVEPYLPNNKIGIMHLAAGIWKGGKDMRLDKSVKIEIKSLNNNAISKSLRFEKVEKK